MSTYLTIEAPSQGLFRDRGSKFLSFAFPLFTEKEVIDQIEILRKEHSKANHHCYAYVLQPDRLTYRSNDDGEPSHSAGDPILGQINSRQLTNIIVIVVRYFGGTKLGVSGLINAYRSAASDALNNASIKQVDIMETITINYPYEATSQVMKMIRELEMEVKDQSFTGSCELSARIKPEYYKVLLQVAGLIKGVKISSAKQFE